MTISTEDFQAKVLDGVGTLTKEQRALGDKVGQVQSKQEQLLADYDRLDKTTKGAFEELTRVKNTCNDQAAAIAALEKVNRRLEEDVKRNWMEENRDPIAKFRRGERAERLLAGIKNIGRGYHSSANMSELEVKALGEDSSPGSTIIDDELAREIYDTLATYGIWNTFAVRNVGTKQTKFPVQTARVLANFITTEAAQISDDSTKAGTSVTAEVEVIAALLNVSVQILQDSPFDVVGDLMREFMESLAYRLDWACLQADGTADATDGGMTGIFGGGGTAATAASGNVTVESTDFEDWTRCLLAVDPIVLNRASRWWMHPQILVRALSVKDGNGRPIFLTATEAPSAKSVGTILGYPVTLAFAAPTTNAANAKVAVFGDPNGMVVGIRRDFGFERSDHFRWDYLQASFRGYGRAAVKVRAATAFGVLTLPAA